MKHALFTLVLAGTLVTLPLSAAYAGESIVRQTPRVDAWKTLPLPPVPHAKTIPWLSSAVDFKSRPNVESQLRPKLDNLAPFLIDAVVPPTQFSAIARSSDWAFE
jgi:hypothetical protein